MHAHTRTAGFSLAELIAVLGLAAILAGLAAPALHHALLLAHARGALDQLVATIFLARMTAVREGRTVDLVLRTSPRRCITGFVLRVRESGTALWSRTAGISHPKLCLRHNQGARDSIRIDSRGMVRGEARSFFFPGSGVRDSAVLSMAGRIRRAP